MSPKPSDDSPSAETPSPDSRSRFDRAIAAIDALNAEDPNQLEVGGALRPKELAHAELVTAWIERLAPDASEALRLAARGHHVRRWTRPRSEHPAGREAYLRWRTGLAEMHAETLRGVLREVGYDASTIERVATIVRKRGLRRDPEIQALEDALCLVFLETQLSELARRVEAEKLVGVLVKSLRKMSPAGRQAATVLEYAPHEATLVERALEALAEPDER